MSKETVYGTKTKPMNKVKEYKPHSDGKQNPECGNAKPKLKCSCGKDNHNITQGLYLEERDMPLGIARKKLRRGLLPHEKGQGCQQAPDESHVSGAN